MSAAAEQIAMKHNAGIGHNAAPELESYVKRLQALEEQKRDLSDDVRELKKEAKEHDLDPRALAQVVKLRLEDDQKREKRKAAEEVLDQYKHQLSMFE